MIASFHRHSMNHQHAVRQKLLSACRSAAPSFAAHAALEPLEPRMLLTAGPVGPELTIGTSIDGYQMNPTVAMDHDGDYVLAWTSGDPNFGFSQIYAQRFDASGIPQTGELLLNDKPGAGLWQAGLAHLSVAMDDEHNFVATWASQVNAPPRSDIYACRYDAATQSLTPAFRVNTFTDNGHMDPSVAIGANGSFMVSWRCSTGQIVARRFDASANPIGTEFDICSYGQGSQDPVVAMAPDDHFVATYATTEGLYARIYDAAGQAQGSEICISTMHWPAQPTVALADDGQFAIAWYGNTPADTTGIYIRFFDSQGIPRGPESLANTYTKDLQRCPAIAMNATGDSVLTWVSRDQDGSGDGIYAQRFDATGQPYGGEFRINTTSTGYQTLPAVAMDDNGDFTVAWDGPRSDGAYGLHAQRFAVSSTPTSVTGHAWNDVNGNNLQDDTETGQDGIVITLMTAAGLPVVSAVTANGGQYRFDALPLDQQYFLQFTPPQKAVLALQNAGQDDSIDSDIDPLTARTDLFTLTADQNNRYFDAGWIPATTVRGTVFLDTNASGRRDANEKGLSGWIVFADANQNGQLDPGELSAHTADDGTYLLTGLPPGSHRITQIRQDLWVMANPQTVNLQVGQAIAGLDFGNYSAATQSVLTPTGNPMRSTLDASANPDSRIAADNNGNFVVVWTQTDASTQQDIIAQRFNADGTAQGSPFRVNTTTAGQQSYFDVAMNAGGQFVIVWHDPGPHGFQSTIRGQRYNANGSPEGSEFLITPSGYSPSVAIDNAGDFAVTFCAASSDIYVQRFNAAGIAQGSPIFANTYRQGSQVLPDIAMDPDGDFVVAWASDRQDGSSYGIYAQRFNPAGQPQGGEFLVNTITDAYQRDPAIAMDPNGNFVITWHHADVVDEFGLDVWGYKVYARRYNSAGIPQGDAFHIDPNGPEHQWNPNVVMMPQGDFVTTWYLPFSESTYAQHYTAAGTPQGAPIRLTGHQSVAADAQGNLIAAGINGDFDNSSQPRTLSIQRYRSVSSDATFIGTGAIDTFYVTRANDEIRIYKSATPSGAPAATYKLNAIQSLTIYGMASSDRVFLDFSNGSPIPTGGFCFNGGKGKDALVLLGTDNTTALSVRPDRVLFNSSRITPANLESLSLGATPTKQILLNSLAIDGPARLRLPAGNHLLATNSLSIRNGGMLDLVDGNLILHTTDQTRDQLLTDTLGLLRSGRSSGATFWQGPGLASFGARTDRQTGLFAALNDQGDSTPILDSLNDLPLSPTDILVLYALNGDTNLDGAITDEDYQHINIGYLLGTTGYRNGDLNYDTLIDAADYFLIDSAYITQPASTADTPTTPPSDSAPTAPPRSSAPTPALASKRPDTPVWDPSPSTDILH